MFCINSRVFFVETALERIKGLPHCLQCLAIQLRIRGGGGGQGGHGPPCPLLKLVIKKMAAIGGPVYFMFLAPPSPSDHPGSDATITAQLISMSDWCHAPPLLPPTTPFLCNNRVDSTVYLTTCRQNLCQSTKQSALFGVHL